MEWGYPDAVQKPTIDTDGTLVDDLITWVALPPPSIKRVIDHGQHPCICGALGQHEGEPLMRRRQQLKHERYGEVTL
jgi:hypothetical protein